MNAREWIESIDDDADDRVAMEAFARPVRGRFVQAHPGDRAGALSALPDSRGPSSADRPRSEASVTWPDNVPRRCDLCAFFVVINPHSPAYGQCVRKAPTMRFDLHNAEPEMGRFPLMPTSGWCGEGEVSIRVERT